MSTYSFQDVNAVMSQPSVGQYVLNGSGLGSITIARTTDNTAMEVAADGRIMTTKIKGSNGTIAISMQQTSPFNAWLKRWYNYIYNASVSQWANTSFTITCLSMGQSYVCTGVAPQKPGDQPFQAQGQQVTWTLMAEDIQEE